MKTIKKFLKGQIIRVSNNPNIIRNSIFLKVHSIGSLAKVTKENYISIDSPHEEFIEIEWIDFHSRYSQSLHMKNDGGFYPDRFVLVDLLGDEIK